MEAKITKTIKNIFSFIQKINWKRVCVACMLLFISGAVVFGILTKSSYDRRSQDPNNYHSAPIAMMTDNIAFDTKKITEQLISASYVLRVKPIHSEPAHLDRKTTLKVLEVYCGEGLNPNSEIVFYETNSFGLFNDDIFSYINYLTCNIMLPEEEYLLFANEKEYHPDYQKRLTTREFVPVSKTPVSWFKIAPSQTAVLQADQKNPPTYGQTKDYEFICFSQQQLDTLNDMKKSLFTQYKIFS